MRLRVRGGLLVLRALDPEAEEVTVPLGEVEGVLIAHPQCTVSARVMSELGRWGVSLVCCDDRRQPSAIMLPIGEHGRIANRFAAQATMSLPVRKKLWRQIVRAKIRNQAAVLSHLHGFDHGLAAMAADVLSGDRTNLEATAAIRYWRHVFEDPDFRRDPSLGGRNAMLNYGYAVLRSVVARAICGSGLHPAVGLHHHSRGNPLCLADDLMEPFRPLVDRAVAGFGLRDAQVPDLDPATKRRLLQALVERVRVRDEQRSPSDIAEHMVRSLARVVDGDADRMWVPLFAL
jgi:CRISPR-associated protein Cas1